MELRKYVEPNHFLAIMQEMLKRDDCPNHNKILIMFSLVFEKEAFPEYPPLICPCEITLKSGEKYIAYLDTDRTQDWIEYGNTFRIRTKGRRNFPRKEVVGWKFL